MYEEKCHVGEGSLKPLSQPPLEVCRVPFLLIIHGRLRSPPLPKATPTCFCTLKVSLCVVRASCARAGALVGKAETPPRMRWYTCCGRGFQQSVSFVVAVLFRPHSQEPALLLLRDAATAARCFFPAVFEQGAGHRQREALAGAAELVWFGGGDVAVCRWPQLF